MAYGKRVAFEEIREADFGDIGAAYAAVGTATSDMARLIGITNNTDDEVYISFDGLTDHLRVAATSFKLLDLTTNEISKGLLLKKGTIFYARRVSGAPTTGSLWIEVMFAEGGV